VTERKVSSVTILDFGPPWRDLLMIHCCLGNISQKNSPSTTAMQDRSGPGIADFGLKKENNLSALNIFRVSSQ
jgi:hypothetical protein